MPTAKVGYEGNVDEEEELGFLAKVKIEVFSIPCARETLLYSLSATLSTYLIHFAFSSNHKRALKWGWGVFPVVYLGYFIPCHYVHMKQKRQFDEIKQIMKDPNRTKRKVEEG